MEAIATDFGIKEALSQLGVKDVNNGTYCMLSSSKCPKDWRNKDDNEIILENNWKLCCRNFD